MTLRIRDLENLEEGRAEGRAEGRVEGRAEGKYESLDSLLKNNPLIGVEKGAALLDFGATELIEYKKTRGLEPVGV